MNEAIFGASIIASFIAGAIALFAPCCVGVLLPTYLASAFSAKRQILKMTLAYFAGIATVLLPIGLGVAGLAQFLQNYHRETYFAGAGLMLVFALMSLSGRGMKLLPSSLREKLQVNNATSAKSVFFVGIFAGASTACCAPVLAGALTLSALSGAFWKALAVMGAYIFGMTLPLFALALAWDKYNWNKSKVIRGKLLSWRVAGKKIFVNSANLIAGGLFSAMAVLLFYLALTDNVFYSPAFQATLGDYLNRTSNSLIIVLSKIPDWMWGIFLLAIFLGFVKNSQSKIDKNK